MKKMLVLISLMSVAAPAFTQALTKEERERAMSELHATRKQFLDSVAGLSEAQWNFKPSPEAWSVAEAAEHIAVSEDTILKLVNENLMKAPAQPDKKAEVSGKDEMILEKMVDRSHKAQAPEMLRPTHRWATQQALVDHFKESRDHTIAYVEQTQDSLRDHFMEHPAFKLMDGYQWLLLISAHSHRHTLQIEEVKAMPNFPKQ
jgi:type II secretory pathway pseudopilin PulG